MKLVALLRFFTILSLAIASFNAVHTVFAVTLIYQTGLDHHDTNKGTSNDTFKALISILNESMLFCPDLTAAAGMGGQGLRDDDGWLDGGFGSGGYSSGGGGGERGERGDWVGGGSQDGAPRAVGPWDPGGCCADHGASWIAQRALPAAGDRRPWHLSAIRWKR